MRRCSSGCCGRLSVTEGQGFRAKGVSADGTEDEDTEGQQMIRPRPDQIGPNVPMIEEDDTEGQGMVGSPRPPVD